MVGRVVFGPVPSRRLGLSLGVNNVFDKYCSYSCVYCSAGHTTKHGYWEALLLRPSRILGGVIWALRDRRVDVVTFVANGEPTLDINLGVEARLLRENIDKPFFGFTNDLVDEIARTIYVHPLRLDYVYKLAGEKGLDGGKVVEELVSRGYAGIVGYMGVEFLVPRTRR